MSDDDPGAPKNVSLAEFAQWADQWRKGDKAKADKLLAAAKRAVLNSQNDPPSPQGTAIQAASAESQKIVMHPISIEIASSMPIDTMAEMQSLYLITKNVIANLIIEWNEKSKIPHSLPTWMKEARTLLVELHKSTSGFQDKVQLKKMDVAAAVIASSSELKDEFKIAMIKELEQYELLAKKPKVVNL
jgi:hypothetical protein